MLADATIENSLNCVEYEEKEVGEEIATFTNTTSESSRDIHFSSSNEFDTLPLL